MTERPKVIAVGTAFVEHTPSAEATCAHPKIRLETKWLICELCGHLWFSSPKLREVT